MRRIGRRRLVALSGVGANLGRALSPQRLSPCGRRAISCVPAALLCRCPAGARSCAVCTVRADVDTAPWSCSPAVRNWARLNAGWRPISAPQRRTASTEIRSATSPGGSAATGVGRPGWWSRPIARPPHRAYGMCHRVSAIIGQGGGRSRRAEWHGRCRNFPPGPVVIVGSDIPDSRGGRYRRRRSAPWETAIWYSVRPPTAVIGWSARGGGRWCRETCSRKVRWSSEHALADTLANVTSRRRVVVTRQFMSA